jgi:hypothetical protein
VAEQPPDSLNQAKPSQSDQGLSINP